MTIGIRDPQLASHVNQIAESIRWPDASFTLSPVEAVIRFVVTLYAGFSTLTVEPPFVPASVKEPQT